MKSRAVSIVSHDEQVLMIRRRKADQTYFTLPGGGVELGETPPQACIRELTEETGLSATIAARLWTVSNAGRIEHYYVMSDAVGEPKLGGPEAVINSPDNSYELVWIPLSELAKTDLKPSFIRDRLCGYFGLG